MPVESYSTAEILLTGRQRLEKPLLWMVWVGTVSFSIVVNNWLYVIASTLAVAVNMIAARENKEIYVRRGLVNAGVLMATGMALFELWGSSNVPLVTVGHYMVLIQLCKLFERKRTRDYVQLLTLNMLLMVTASLQSTSPWFALVILGYMILACHVLMVFTLKRGLDEAAGKHLRSEAGPLAPQRVAWNVVRGWPGKTLRRLLITVMIPSLVIGLAAFLLMPRAADAMLPFAPALFGGRFGEDVRLGGPKELYLSDRVVMRVRVITDGEPGVAPNDGARYLRRRTLNSYSNSTWRRQSSEAASPGEVWPEKPENWRRETIRHEIDMNSLGAPDLPAPYPTIDLGLHGRGDLRITENFNYELAGRPNSSTIDYTTHSLPQPLRDEHVSYLAAARAGRPPVQNMSVSLPDDARRRILDLARDWAGDLLAKRQQQPEKRDAINLDIARRLSLKLKGHCSYSLDLSDASATRDGVEDFLFHMRSGHCEYFASSLAVMCRLLGIPARVAVGFMLAEYDPDDGRYTVRERDAHAWCEVYTTQTDWTILDPTPGSDRLESMGMSWWQKLRDFFQEMRFSWNRNIVGYEESHRQDIRGGALQWMRETWAKITAWLTSLKESFMRWLREGIVDRLLLNFLVLLLAVALVAFALIVLGPVIRKHRRHRRRLARTGGPKVLPPLQKLLLALARKGFYRRPGQTLREYLPAAADEFALPRGPMLHLAELQYRYRWGQHEPSDEQLIAAQDVVARLTGSLHGRDKD